MAVIVVLMVVAGCALVTAGVAMQFGTAAGLVVAGLAVLGGAWLTDKVLREA